MNNGTPDWFELLGLLKLQAADLILVGLPLNMDGTESHLSKRAHKFAKRLNHQLKATHNPIQVALIDERLSSFEARTQSKNSPLSRPIDDRAAQLLIQSFFNEPDQLIEL